MDTVRASANGVFGYLTPALRARRYLVSYAVVLLSAQLVVETVEESVRGSASWVPWYLTPVPRARRYFCLSGGGCATPDEYVTVFVFFFFFFFLLSAQLVVETGGVFTCRCTISLL